MFTHFTVEDGVSSVMLGVVVLVVLVGNCLVVAAVATSRKLRTVTNMFIVNLACADLMLGVFVLPFSAALEILNTWTFGHVWCQIWLAVDVWLCTASILNLCCISLDRYLAITRPIQYPGIMSARRVKLLVVGIWIFSFIICCPPLIGWNSLHDEANDVTSTDMTTVSPTTEEPLLQGVDCVSLSPNSSVDIQISCQTNIFNISNTKCELTNSRGYRIYAALGSFFIPMLVMVFFYLQIYRAAVRTISAYEKGELKTKHSSGDSVNGVKSSNAVTLRVHRGGGSVNSHTGSIYSRSPARKTNSSEASLVTLTDLSKSDSSAGNEPIRSGSTKEVTSKDIQTFCGNSKRTPSFEKKRTVHSFRNGFRGFRYSSRDSDDGRNSDEIVDRNGLDKNHEDSFRIRRYPLSSSTTNYSSRSLSRDSSERERLPRFKRNMFSVHRPAHAMKLHMQKFNREKKAAKTLAIIVGAFIVCWLPFFTIYLVGAFCESCISAMLFSVAFWLGYCNSAMNPCVYALFSRDFRAAFRKLILCRFGSHPGTFRQQLSGLPAIQLHSPPREYKSSTDFEGNNWR